MHFDFGPVALDLPYVLRDETTYTFENQEQGETLSVVGEPPEPRLTPAEVIEDLVRPLRRAMHPVFLTTAEDLVFLGRPAHKAEFQIGPAGRLRMFILVATGPLETHVVRWFFGALKGDEPERFAQLIESARSSQEPWSRDGGPGRVRHQTGSLTIEVPDSLPPPSGFVFASEGAAVRVTFDYLDVTAAPGPPEFEEILPLDPEDRLTVDGVEEHRLGGSPFDGWSARYDLTRVSAAGSLQEHLVRQFKIAVADERQFRATGVAGSAAMRQLDVLWSQIEATLKRGK